MVSRFLRSLLSGAFFVAYGVFALLFAPFLLVLPRCTGRAAVRIFYRLFVLTARWTGLYRVECSEADRALIAASRGRVIVANHVSLIDICIIFALLPDSVCVAKAAAKRNPVLAPFVSRLFISNDSGGEKALAEAKAYLASGVNVVVFPQGTRGGTTMHRGAARIALATRAETLAMRLDYDPVVLAKGQPWWDVGPRTIRIKVSAPGVLVAEGEANHREAVRLTSEYASLLGIWYSPPHVARHRAEGAFAMSS